MLVDDFLGFLCGYLVVLSVLFLLGAVYWVFRFVQLMALDEEDFPGRHDKTLWVIAFVVANVFAAVAFHWWKAVMREMRAAERESKGRQQGNSTA